MTRRTQTFLATVLLVGLMLATAPVAHVDVTITLETETKSASGTQKTTTTQYYTPTKMRTDSGQASISITDLDNERVITLMPAMKTYIEYTFEQMKAGAEQFKGAEPELTVEETEEKQEINGYSCRKVVVRVEAGGNETVVEHWMTKEAKGIGAVHEFQKNMYEKLKDLPQAAANLKAMQTFADKGMFPIKTVTRMKTPMGEMTTTQTVTKIEEGDLDDELFEIPEGYTKQTFGPPGGGPGSKQ